MKYYIIKHLVFIAGSLSAASKSSSSSQAYANARVCNKEGHSYIVSFTNNWPLFKTIVDARFNSKQMSLSSEQLERLQLVLSSAKEDIERLDIQPAPGSFIEACYKACSTDPSTLLEDKNVRSAIRTEFNCAWPIVIYESPEVISKFYSKEECDLLRHAPKTYAKAMDLKRLCHKIKHQTERFVGMDSCDANVWIMTKALRMIELHAIAQQVGPDAFPTRIS